MSAAGASLFHKIFGTEFPSWWTDLQQQIKEMLMIAEIQNDILEVHGYIDGVLLDVSDYENAKGNNTSQENLTTLGNINTTINDHIIGQLQVIIGSGELPTKGPGQQAFILFLLAGQMQFTILQEMAKIDQPSSPDASPYAKDIKDHATQYYQTALKLYNSIVSARQRAFSPVIVEYGNTRPSHINAFFIDSWIPETTCFFQEYWSEDNYHNIYHSKAYSDASVCATGQIQDTMGQFFVSLQDKYFTIHHGWHTLKTKPMGTGGSAAETA